jgi:ankyrin repeat protein
MSSALGETDEIIDAIQAGDENTINSLPPEVLLNIIENLPVNEILRLCQVSKRVYDLICLNQDIWRYFFRRDISTIAIPPNNDYRAAYLSAMRLADEIRRFCRLVYWTGERQITFRLVVSLGYDRLFHTLIRPCFKTREDLKYTSSLDLPSLNDRRELDRLIGIALEQNYSALAHELVDLYIAQKNEPSFKGINGQFISPQSIVKLNRRDLIDYFLDHGYDPDEFIWPAVRTNQVEILKYLAERGVDLRDQASRILEVAGENGSSDAARFTLTLGASERQLESAIEAAAYSDQWSFVREFLPEVPSQGLGARVALRQASHNGQVEMVKFILDRLDHAPIIPQFQRSLNRALVRAANNNHTDIVQLLIPYVQPDQLHSAFYAAYSKRYFHVARLLQQAGAPLYPPETGENVNAENDEEVEDEEEAENDDDDD